MSTCNSTVASRHSISFSLVVLLVYGEKGVLLLTKDRKVYFDQKRGSVVIASASGDTVSAIAAGKNVGDYP